jgi:hypothetical protein
MERLGPIKSDDGMIVNVGEAAATMHLCSAIGPWKRMACGRNGKHGISDKTRSFST